MFAKPIARWMQQRGLFYGWVVVFVSFLTLLTTAGAMGLPGALIKPLGQEFGWSIADISQALAIRLLLFGLIAPFAAAVMEKYGIRNIVLTAIALIFSALVLALVMTSYWHLLVLWGFVVGLGTGLTAMVFGAIVAGNWFTRHRGLVLGFLSASSATGQLAFIPLTTWLVDHAGWRAAVMPTLGGLAVAGVAVLMFMADRPSDIGIPPLGETSIVPKNAVTTNAFLRAFAVLGEASKIPAFWILAGTFFICGFSTNGLIQQHFISFCGDFNMLATDAGIVLAMMGAFDFFGTIASGYLSDRIDNRILLFFYYGLRGLSLLFLPYANFSIVGLSVFAAFYGLDWIATVPPTVNLTRTIFGREKAGIVFGWVYASHMVGAASAAWSAGLSKTILASYLPAFYGAGVLCLIAAGCCLLLKTPGEKASAKPLVVASA